MSKRQPIKKACQKQNCNNPNCPFPHVRPSVDELELSVQDETSSKLSAGAVAALSTPVDVRVSATTSRENKSAPGSTKSKASASRVDEGRASICVQGGVRRDCVRCGQRFTLSTEALEFYK
jgi:hypothetical protein